MSVKILLRKMLQSCVDALDRSIKHSAETAPKIKVRRFFRREIKIYLLPNFIICFIFLFYILLGEIPFDRRNITGLFILLSGLCLALYLMASKLKMNSEESGNSLIIFDLLLIISVSSIKAVHSFTSFSPLVFPVAGFVILAVMLVGYRAAAMLFFTIFVIYSIFPVFSLQHFLFGLTGSAVSAYAASNIRHRRDVVRIFPFLLAANVLLLISFGLLSRFEGMDILKNSYAGIINAFISVILVLGFLPFMENAFSILTSIKLTELTDFNQPLLRKLMIEAPGTYHHSLFVGSLAEQAASLIGANSGLAKVGGYYHDIGKVVKPDYFIENQKIFHVDNRHEDLNPNMSVLVILSHIKEGVRLAEEHGLDRGIIAFINQHHGTSLIEYFYKLAKTKDPDTQEAIFRYPGPKPTTKETAIVMLADSIEASVRAMDNPTHSRLKDTVYNIINTRFADGQFDNAPITLRDLHQIAEQMINNLVGYYHARIDYAEAFQNNVKA